MGYLIPGPDGPRVLPDWQSCWDTIAAAVGRHLEILVDSKLFFCVFNLDSDSYERYLNFDTGVLHRISSRIYIAEWFSLGSHFEKNTKYEEQ